MSLFAELKQAYYDLPLASKPRRDVVAHFCEHDGIRIEFSRARTTWHAIAPSSVKPWWLILEPLITPKNRKPSKQDKQANSKKPEKVLEYETLA